MSNIPAGWYPDNTDTSLQRYWDGTAWTQHTAPAAPPAPPASAASGTGYERSTFTAPTAAAPVETGTPVTTPPYANSASVPPYAAAVPRGAAHSPATAPGAARPRRAWIPIVIIAASVVVLLVIAGGVFAVVNLMNRGLPTLADSSATPVPTSPSDPTPSAAPEDTGDLFTADDLTVFAVGNALLPADYEAFDSSFTDATAGDGLATADSEWFEYNGAPAECEDLNFYEPLTSSTDAGSLDPIAAVGAYGTDTDALEAHARVFPDEAAAFAQLANTDAEIGLCAAGYGTDNFHADSVAPIRTDLPSGITATGWQEQGLSNGDAYYFETVEMQRGNLVVRANCYLPAEGGGTSDICGIWYDQVATDLLQLTSGSET
ncbi:DUF2510 domain-containing protein [Naasia lichenicola]|uniref:DUF2510 domain-containing protein n=1 Tax=Naasia lichenicola TaxID=2565933 RepID=A0A4S4FNZ3_9MICO|nr:DUF2510 domain-containing protein [Naasia lichenicola]THG30731.1 DUF2510 domain-containing protein [Naasia lichenicola]THG31968.1 DUF2510 domain-containing protein [Naasia lichenicola]